MIDNSANQFMQNLLNRKFVAATQMLKDKTINIHYDNEYFLREMVKLGNFEAVKFLINRGANPHAFDGVAMKIASSNGYTSIVSHLIEVGVDIHNSDEAALRMAARNGKLDVMKILISNGANWKCDNNSIFENSCAEGYYDIVKYLISLGADINAYNGVAIKKAIKYGHYTIVKLLIDNKAHLCFKDDKLLEITMKHCSDPEILNLITKSVGGKSKVERIEEKIERDNSRENVVKNIILDSTKRNISYLRRLEDKMEYQKDYRIKDQEEKIKDLEKQIKMYQESFDALKKENKEVVSTKMKRLDYENKVSAVKKQQKRKVNEKPVEPFVERAELAKILSITLSYLSIVCAQNKVEVVKYKRKDYINLEDFNNKIPERFLQHKRSHEIIEANENNLTITKIMKDPRISKHNLTRKTISRLVRRLDLVKCKENGNGNKIVCKDGAIEVIALFLQQ